MAEAGPRPGKTPTRVPNRQPTVANPMFAKLSAFIRASKMPTCMTRPSALSHQRRGAMEVGNRQIQRLVHTRERVACAPGAGQIGQSLDPDAMRMLIESGDGQPDHFRMDERVSLARSLGVVRRHAVERYDMQRSLR